ncbi:MAG: 4-alpha-glucanotransferase [Actinomycetia bacterium]|nr:4-alpha-glucanotransferase [Actinomycetes bacterium]
MTDEPLNTLVHDLAAVAGVAPTWIDAWGNPQTVVESDLLAVLSAVTGRSLDSELSIVEASSSIQGALPPIEPVLVAWDGELTIPPVSFEVREAVVILDGGEVIPVEVSVGAMSATKKLPMGYHQLSINGGDITAHVFSAPMRAHPAPQHALGLIAPMYSLVGPSVDHGIGTIAELDTMADMCQDVGIEIIGTLPLLATFPDQPSPYAPVSRRAWSELFADFSQIPGWSEDPQHPGNDPLWVDYEGTGSRIRESLARYARKVSASPQLRSRVESFLRRVPDMIEYARFRALGERYGINPAGWPQGAEPPPERVRYHETVQWLMDLQLSGMSERLRDRGQFLYLDLPIGCHPDGYDIWDQPELFAPAGLGAPPDPLFVGGQDWGLPATIPTLARLDGHTNFRKAIRHQFSVAGLLRIDHVMGIHRTWWVPHGAGANQGAYVMQPTEEMFAIICIESVRAGAGVVGENLGTVPPEIGEGLEAHGLLGMTVAQDGPNMPASTDAIAMSSHDTPAFAAWWKGLDIADMLDLGIFDEERAVHEREARSRSIAGLESYFSTSGPIATRDALMEWIAGTDAAIALLNLDDLVMEERRQNVPGTYMERPNWRLRNRVTIDDLAADESFTGLLRHLATTRRGA